jgi:metallo-beta-lactamase class B
MINARLAPFLLLALAACTTAPPKSLRLSTDAEIDAAMKEPISAFAEEGEWNTPFTPFNIIGNIYYVGTAGIGAYLITTPKGHILIDGILAQSAPQIIANVKTLGYDMRDVKFLLNSHAHFDHAAGLAALQRASGAKMVASSADKPILEAGQISYGPSAGTHFPAIRVDRVIREGETISLGGITLTARMTPGHTPGCTSWSMAVKAKDGRTHNAFFHCSSTVAGQSLVPESYPGMVADYRATFAKIRSLSADVFLANHDSFFALAEKRAKQQAGDANAFVDAGELQQFNRDMEKAFEAELTRQQKTARQTTVRQ